MQFLRTIDGAVIPETHVVFISKRYPPGAVGFGEPVNVAHHYITATISLRPNLDSLDHQEFIASANEVARFIKAAEAPDAPAQRQFVKVLP